MPKTQDERRDYQRKYYCDRYRNDEAFRKRLQENSRQRYQRKTANCDKCKGRFKPPPEETPTLCDRCKNKQREDDIKN